MNGVAALEGGAVLRVLLSPGRSSAGVRGFDTWRDAWRVEVTEPAERDRANRALLRFLAETLDLPREGVSLASGARDRLKVVHVRGRSPEQVAGRLRGSP